MALTTGGFANSGDLVLLTPRGVDAEKNQVKPYFQIARIVDGKIAQTDETADQVSGDLIKVEIKQREFKGIKTDVVAVYLSDKASNETYGLSLTFSLAARSLFNTLIALENDFTGLNISYYRNKKGFEAYGVKQHGQKTQWKYALEDLPEVEKIFDKKGTFVKNDYSEVDDLFKNELIELGKRIAASHGNSQSTNSETSNEAANEDNEAPAPVTPPPAAKPTMSKPAANKAAPASTANKTKSSRPAASRPASTPTPDKQDQEAVDEDIPF